MRFEREEGFWLGGYVINFATGEAGILVLLAVLILLVVNGHHVNAGLFLGLGLALAIAGPVLTFPPSRTVWSAIDLIMRPLTEEERVSAQAFVAASAMQLEPEDAPPPPARPDRTGP